MPFYFFICFMAITSDNAKVIFFVFVLIAKFGNNKSFAMDKTMLIHTGQGKDFQSQIGGNCDWKFFLRLYSFVNVQICVYNFFSHISHAYKAIITYFLAFVKTLSSFSFYLKGFYSFLDIFFTP